METSNSCWPYKRYTRVFYLVFHVHPNKVIRWWESPLVSGKLVYVMLASKAIQAGGKKLFKVKTIRRLSGLISF